MTLTIAGALLAFALGGMVGMFAMALAAASRYDDDTREIRMLRQALASQEETIEVMGAERDRLTRRVGHLAAVRGEKP